MPGMTSSSTPDSTRRYSAQRQLLDTPNRTPTKTNVAKKPEPLDVDGTQVLISLFRAILARSLFIVHSIVTVWQTVTIEGREGVWVFALISLLIVFEGSHTIIMRAGDERKWFCTSVLLYIISTAPPIWLLETKMCEWRKELSETGSSDVLIRGAEEELRLQLLEQLLLVTLIIGRWLLPKGDISREQLSQILLAYLAISSDIVEFFDVFKERVVFQNRQVQKIVLAAWTLSLLQFPFVLTVSRARKMRVAITKTYDELLIPTRKRSLWDVFHDVDIWAIILANFLQDIPFLLVRLHLMLHHSLVTYTMIFFTCKNALIIMLQTYRALILVNDRYIHPRPADLAMFDELEPFQHDQNQNKRYNGTKRRRPRKERYEREFPSSRRDRNRNHRHGHRRRELDILEETIS